MGLFDGITDLFDNAVSGLFGSVSGSFLGGSDQLGGGGSSFLPVSYQPYQTQTFQNPVTYAQPVMASVPAVVTGGMRVMQRFPALWAALSALTTQFGKRFTPELLWRMVRTQGPGLVAGLIGAAAMNELAIWRATTKSRRMNPANTKALRRGLRRLKAFERLSHRVSGQLSRVSGSRRRSVRRCGTCRKNPCAC